MHYTQKDYEDEGDVLGLGCCMIGYTVAYTRQAGIPGVWHDANGDGYPDVPEQVDADLLEIDRIYAKPGQALTRPATQADIDAAHRLVNDSIDWDELELEMVDYEDDD